MILKASNWQGNILELEIEGGVYRRIDTLPGQADPTFPKIAPGLIDLQVNGFGGIDFNQPMVSESGWHQATQKLYEQGCTGFLLTLITNTEEQAWKLLTEWTARLRRDPRNCFGFHLEGPWLNPDPGTRGAHRAEWMQKPSLRFLEKSHAIAGDYLKLITLAPETDLPASEEVIRAGRKKGIHFFIGHSLAMGEVLDRAIAAGAVGWTHLGNAAPSPAPKFENVIFHALARPELLASLIPDGLHLPPHVLRSMAQALGSRLLLTTDAMAGAAVVPGTYSLGKTEVIVDQDGSARLPGSGRLAGSTLTPLKGVLRMHQITGLEMEKSWDAFSIRPARLFQHFHDLEEGQSADFCLLVPGNHALQATYHRGEEVYRTS